MNNYKGPMEEIFTVGNGTRTALGKNGHNMKRNRQILKARTRLSLGDLILAVSSCTNSSRETVATVADLLASGRVRLQDNGRFLRARVC
jgi:aconitase A